MRRLALLVALLWAAPAHGAGTVLLVPGSGFSGITPKEQANLSIGRRHWRDWGFATQVVRYRAGKRGLADVRQAVGRAAARGPVCVYGESSGGTWALIAAAAQGVACVVVSVSPTDQETWAQSESHGARVLSTRRWPSYFGPADQDAGYEPFDVWALFEPRVPAFLIYAKSDLVVPPQQGEIFASVGADVRLRVLRRGARMFVHSKVRRDDLLRVRGEARMFVFAAMRGARAGIRPAP